MVYLTCAVTGLGGRGGNKQVLKRHQSASFLCCHVRYYLFGKSALELSKPARWEAYLGFSSMKDQGVLVYCCIAAPLPNPSFPLPNRVTPSSVVCRRYPYMHLFRVKRVKVLV